MIPTTSIPIPDDWTVDEAAAVFEFFKSISNAVWDKYERPLVMYYRENIVFYFDEKDPYGDIPF